MRKLAETSLPVNADTIAKAVDWLESIGQQQQWPARTVFKLRLCMDETLTNIAMHGYTGAPSTVTPHVALQLHQEGRRIQLDILDNGVAFDPTARTPRDLDVSLDEAQIGGHGLRLLQHYLEDVRYERRAGWNCLQLIALLDDVQSGPEHDDS